MRRGGRGGRQEGARWRGRKGDIIFFLNLLLGPSMGPRRPASPKPSPALAQQAPAQSLGGRGPLAVGTWSTGHCALRAEVPACLAWAGFRGHEPRRMTAHPALRLQRWNQSSSDADRAHRIATACPSCPRESWKRHTGSDAQTALVHVWSREGNGGRGHHDLKVPSPTR